MTVAVGFIPRSCTFNGMSRGATIERRGVLDAREVQASLRDAVPGLRWFRGRKRHGYRHEVAPRLRGGEIFRCAWMLQRGRASGAANYFKA